MSGTKYKSEKFILQDNLKNIHDGLDKDLSINERKEYIDDLFENTYNRDANIDAIIDYLSSPYFRVINGGRGSKGKKKSHLRAEERYFEKGMSYTADYLLDRWGEYQDRDEKYEDYTWFKNINDRNNKAIHIAVEPNENYQEFEIDIAAIEYLQEKEELILSNDDRRKLRWEQVHSNLDDPILQEKSSLYFEMGIKYGFSMDDYNKEERAEIQEKWIEYLEQEKESGKHTMSGKQRMYLLNKNYNRLGYELFAINEVRRDSIQSKPNKQPAQRKVDINGSAYFEQMLKDYFDLKNPKHVSALLQIDRIAIGDYYPIFVELERKYKVEVESDINILLEEFDDALRLTDLNEEEKDILFFIMDHHNDFTIYKSDTRDNPYNFITRYINDKYGLNRSRRDIFSIINRASRKIANTYTDLENGIGMKKCTSCNLEKLASHNNFGIDKRNKDGFKSICKKCAVKKEQKRREIS